MASHDKVKALLLNTDDHGRSIVGIYTDDEEGNKILQRVARNMETKHPTRTKIYTFMLNIPNK